jgi:hypothetical protein
LDWPKQTYRSPRNDATFSEHVHGERDSVRKTDRHGLAIQRRGFESRFLADADGGLIEPRVPRTYSAFGFTSACGAGPDA